MKLIVLLLLHFLADWALQSKKMGKEKSEEFNVLLQHISIHLIVFLLGCLTVFTFKQALFLSLANALIHGVIDWNIWRFYKITVWWRRNIYIPSSLLRNIDETTIERQRQYLSIHFRYWEDKVFHLFLGFDQLLHYVTLVVLFNML